jgi:hydrogenase nickel incorporation protein HypA/HybF
MHEYSIVQSLVDSVEKAVLRPLCGEKRYHKEDEEDEVRRIVVRIGELSGVDCELLATAYEVFRAGTICENATMTIDRIPARWACPKCDRDIPRGAVLRCAECNEPAQLASGDELILQRIEMEVPHVSGLRMR